MDHSAPQFDNQFIQQLPGDTSTLPGSRAVAEAWSAVMPTPVSAPRVLAVTAALAAELGFDGATTASEDFAAVFGGNALYAGMRPWAANYGGHQFGQWAGQLGDGRAISLGELAAADGRRWELQLKGAGATPYSRHADGRAVLRSSIREFLCSEAMHHLGVPTTRALSLVSTGDTVLRDMFYDGHPAAEPGAVVCRVAPSFVRFGTFELPAARGEYALLRELVAFCIARDYPHLATLPVPEQEWFGQVCERSAEMVAGWMRVGFVHGVMNTDNMSILGLTLDYGPYGWMEDYDPDWTPNTTDAQGRRYRFGTQPDVVRWNLVRLAQALAPLFTDVAPLQEGLARFERTLVQAQAHDAGRKLGLPPGPAADALMEQLRALMQQGGMDMTLTFRALMQVDPARPDVALFAPVFPDAQRERQVAPALQAWLQAHAAQVEASSVEPGTRLHDMAQSNPQYVLRNWMAQQAIVAAEQGDLAPLQRLQRVLMDPYQVQDGCEDLACRRPDWAVTTPGCGMLSCSS